MKNIYYSHPMERGRSLEETKLRGVIFEQKVGKRFKVWHPEDHQARWEGQKKTDLDAEYNCDILVIDMWNVGVKTELGVMMGEGTNAEMGFMFALNKDRKKKVPIFIIMPKKKPHCFRVVGKYQDYGVTRIFHSIDECAKHVKQLKK